MHCNTLYTHNFCFSLALVSNGEHGEGQDGAISVVMHWLSRRCTPTDDNRGKQNAP